MEKYTGYADNFRWNDLKNLVHPKAQMSARCQRIRRNELEHFVDPLWIYVPGKELYPHSLYMVVSNTHGGSQSMKLAPLASEAKRRADREVDSLRAVQVSVLAISSCPVDFVPVLVAQK